MFRLLDRYVIREIFPYFVMGFFLLTSIIFVREANRFSELFIVFSQRGLSSGPLIVLVISLLPSILVFTLPIAFLLAVLLAMGRLSGDSEIVVMTASGVSPRQLLRPVLIFGLVVTALTAYNTFYLLPVSVNSLNQLKKKRNQVVLQSITTQIKPGNFAENISKSPNRVLYIERNDRVTDTWSNLFIAEQEDEEENKEPKIYAAKGGRLVLGESLEETELWLDDSHAYDSEARRSGKKESSKYSATFSKKAVIRFEIGGDSTPSPTSELSTVPSGPDLMTLPQLWNAVPDAGRERLFKVELHKRFALPVACVFFALAGVALGVTVTRGGRSSGLFVGLVLTLSYYLMFLSGERAARQGVVPVEVGMWGPDLLLAAVSLWLFAGGQARLGGSAPVKAFWRAWQRLTAPIVRGLGGLKRAFIETSQTSLLPSRNGRPSGPSVGLGFPRLIDRMIFVEASRHFLFVLAGLCGIFAVFTLFDLINPIVQNKIGAGLVFEYLFFLSPQIIQYMVPFSVLVAVMVTFGLFGKTSQLVALNSSGQSLYRLTFPILFGALLTGGLMLGSQEFVLPFTNRTQDYLRYLIKGGNLPAQTFYQTNRKWFYGQGHRIFNFRHFDTTKKEFVGLAIYEINPETAGLVSRRYAKSAAWDPKTSEWVLSKGWVRTFTSEGNPGERTEIKEERLRIPEGPDYFTQETPESSKMSIRQLRDQIADLKQNGLDPLNLDIALQGKLAAPLTCLVMALVGLPFSFTVGKRGALAGVGIGLAIAVVFWGAIGVFDQLGRYELLPPFWAAWGPNLLFSVGGLYLLFTAKT